MRKLLLVVLVLVLSVPAFAGGIVPRATNTISTTKDTIAPFAAPMADYTQAKFVFKITEADTLRDDTVNVYIQGSHLRSSGFTNAFHLLRDASDTSTTVKYFDVDWIHTDSGYNFTNYAQFYIFFEDSSGYTDSEIVRPAADKTSGWSSTGANDYGEIDEASPDIADYVYILADGDSVIAVTMGDHLATESTVDSVRINYTIQHIPITSEVIYPSSDYIAGWNSTAANHYGEIDEALGSEDTSDYIYILGPDTVACIAIANIDSVGDADIDSAVLSVLTHSYVALCTLEVGLCVSSATCDTCDCLTDTIALTTDTTRFPVLFTTSPATGLAWTAAELDSATFFVRSLGFEASAEATISQVVLTPYYGSDASVKCAICLTDTSRCEWSDSTAVVSDSASHTFVLALSPDGDAWYIADTDSLVGTIKSQHMDNGSMRVFMEWMTIYYTAGTLVPAFGYEAYIILKE